MDLPLRVAVGQHGRGLELKQGRSGEHDHADQLASRLSLDMGRWWTPSLDGFYGRLPKAALAQAVSEAKMAAAPFESVKKTKAAAMAAKALRDSGWLPSPLRSLS